MLATLRLSALLDDEALQSGPAARTYVHYLGEEDAAWRVLQSSWRAAMEAALNDKNRGNPSGAPVRLTPDEAAEAAAKARRALGLAASADEEPEESKPPAKSAPSRSSQSQPAGRKASAVQEDVRRQSAVGVWRSAAWQEARLAATTSSHLSSGRKQEGPSGAVESAAADSLQRPSRRRSRSRSRSRRLARDRRGEH